MNTLHPIFEQALAPFVTKTNNTARVWNDDDVYIVDAQTARIIEHIPSSMRRPGFSRYEVLPGYAVLTGMQAKHLGWLQ